MKTRNSIVPEYWGLVIDEMRRRHGNSAISLDVLRQMRTERFARVANDHAQARAAERARSPWRIVIHARKAA